MIYVTPDLKQIYTTNVSSARSAFWKSRSATHGSSSGNAATGQLRLARRRAHRQPYGLDSDRHSCRQRRRRLRRFARWTRTLDGECARRHTFSYRSCKPESYRYSGREDFGANRLKFTPDGKLVLISCWVAAISSSTTPLRARNSNAVPIGHGAAGILIDPDGNGPSFPVAPITMSLCWTSRLWKSQATSTSAASPTAWPGRASRRSLWAIWVGRPAGYHLFDVFPANHGS